MVIYLKIVILFSRCLLFGVGQLSGKDCCSGTFLNSRFLSTCLFQIWLDLVNPNGEQLGFGYIPLPCKGQVKQTLFVTFGTALFSVLLFLWGILLVAWCFNWIRYRQVFYPNILFLLLMVFFSSNELNCTL